MPEGQKYVERLKKISHVWEKKILIVDDSKSLVDLLSGFLEKEGSIDTANNGAEALSKLETTFYDAIVSDVRMPSLDGISFYKEAYKNEPNLRERIIFLTGLADETQVAFFKENNLRFMIKPFDLDALQKNIHDMLSSTKPHA